MPDFSQSSWHHAPHHEFVTAGTYFVTGSTLYKEHHFASKARLDFFTWALLDAAERRGWKLQAWALFSNHYHFVGYSEEPQTLHDFIQRFHSAVAREMNRLDDTPGRQVLYQFWDTLISFRPSYYTRLRYVIENPVRHRLVRAANEYPWCSAAWFERKASVAFQKKLQTFKIDKVRVHDDFEVIEPQ